MEASGHGEGENMGILSPKLEANGETIMGIWNRVSTLPGGKRFFSKMIGRMAPYTGSIGAVVDHVEPGYARLHMTDRKKVRNHLQSIHAVALVNFVEETTGMAMVSQFPSGVRGIVKKIDVDFIKKARGTVVAECRAPELHATEQQEYIVETHVKNEAGDVVSIGRAVWLVGPV